jgi:hypothetical protein
LTFGFQSVIFSISRETERGRRRTVRCPVISCLRAWPCSRMLRLNGWNNRDPLMPHKVAHVRYRYGRQSILVSKARSCGCRQKCSAIKQNHRVNVGGASKNQRPNDPGPNDRGPKHIEKHSQSNREKPQYPNQLIPQTWI